jgi:hypothetical protein
MERQLADLQKQLPTVMDNEPIRLAVQSQINSLIKKINAKKGRKAKLADGTEVGIGDLVFGAQRPYSDSTGERIYDGAINGKLIVGVSPDGLEITFDDYGRKHFYAASGYFGSVETAWQGVIAAAERWLEKKQYQLEVAEREVRQAEAALAHATENQPKLTGVLP